MDNNVHQFAFDFIIKNHDNDNKFEELKRKILEAIEQSDLGIEIVGAAFPDDSTWTKEEYGLKD